MVAPKEARCALYSRKSTEEESSSSSNAYKTSEKRSTKKSRTQLDSAQQPGTPTDLTQDIKALSRAVEGIQNDLQEVKTLLRRRPPAPGAAAQNFELDIADRPFPLESIHKHAFKAAEAARCAGEQGKYWEMHDQLFANQTTLSAWTDHAQAVGLDVASFEGCLSSGKFAADIRNGLTMAQGAGITGTPGFFLAVADPGSTKVKTVRLIKGAQLYAAFKHRLTACSASWEAQIDGLLAELEAPAARS